MDLVAGVTPFNVSKFIFVKYFQVAIVHAFCFKLCLHRPTKKMWARWRTLLLIKKRQ